MTGDDYWAGPLVCRDYHLVGADGQALAEPFGAMWAFRDIAPRERALAAALSFAVEDALYALRRARRVWLPWLSDGRTTVGRVATAIHRRLIR
ncbi:MAG: hypothetical protein EPO26_04205 [Chloroflexota bacterium]|nr:MAG: hypothetical protein EPO26_04205 [Chloroflexota bacterium]